MSIKQHFTTEQARQFGDEFGIDWEWGCASVEQLSKELDVDFEHGLYRRGAKVKGKSTSPSVASGPFCSLKKKARGKTVAK
jgi:hypothetical protein